MGTHLRVLTESNPMNTNMTGLKMFLAKIELRIDCTIDISLLMLLAANLAVQIDAKKPLKNVLNVIQELN